MQLAIETVGTVAIAPIPVEELDAGNAGEFKRDIAPLLEARSNLVLDLSRLRSSTAQVSARSSPASAR